MWLVWNWHGSMINRSCRAGWSVPVSAVQGSSSSTLCRFALWFSGTGCDLAGHHSYATLADLSQTKWLYELINSAAGLFIIGLEVHWAMHWTRAKINDWKLFTCITLPLFFVVALCLHQAFLHTKHLQSTRHFWQIMLITEAHLSFPLSPQLGN